MIKLEQLSFNYPDGPEIFSGFSWLVESGESWSVLGPSGCGKTTLLYLLAGLVFPVSGGLTIDGKILTRPRPETGLILQDYGLLPWATVLNNAALGITIRGFYGPDGKHVPENFTPDNDANYWIDELGLNSVKEKFPSEISGGQRQRTAIARTLALQPDLLLMDEPFSSLDAPTRENLQQLTLRLWQQHNLTIVAVTHSIEEAALLGQKILILGSIPNARTFVIENPGVLEENFRYSSNYPQLCYTLRQAIRTNEKP
jgi:NitT/TauT family transport system ATP-binding protein